MGQRQQATLSLTPWWCLIYSIFFLFHYAWEDVFPGQFFSIPFVVFGFGDSDCSVVGCVQCALDGLGRAIWIRWDAKHSNDGFTNGWQSFELRIEDNESIFGVSSVSFRFHVEAVASRSREQRHLAGRDLELVFEEIVHIEGVSRDSIWNW